MKSSAPVPGQAGLPPGWSMGTDPCSGYPYYANLATGHTQWHPPQPEAPPPPPPPAALPAGWVAATDPASGHTYYTNPTTGQSSWTPPLPPPTFSTPIVSPPVAPAPVAPMAAAPARGCTVKIKWLPSSFAEADVRELFGKCGKITHVSLDRGDYSSQTTPKNGSVSFDAVGSAKAAVAEMDGLKLRRYTLQVELADDES